MIRKATGYLPIRPEVKLVAVDGARDAWTVGFCYTCRILSPNRRRRQHRTALLDNICMIIYKSE